MNSMRLLTDQESIKYNLKSNNLYSSFLDNSKHLIINMYSFKNIVFTILYKPIAYFKTFRLWYKKIFHVHNKSGLEVKLPFWIKIKYNLRGFTDLEYTIFNLKQNDYHNYISTWERLRLENVNGRFSFFLGEKVMFERMFGQYVNVPHIHCWVKSGKFINLDDNKNEVSIIEEIQREKRFIAKPTRSLGGGKRIHELTYDGGLFYFDGQQLDANEFVQKCRKLEEYIITKKVSSHIYSRTIYPYSANTIRVITVMNNDNNNADVLLAFHRFGTQKSRFVDNINSGGIYALVDIETGKIGYGKCLYDINCTEKIYVKHPDTNTAIMDIYIPKWLELIESLKHAHKCFAYYQFFAWDVTIDQEGKFWVLEINRGSDLEIQSICPLRNEKLGKWMKEKNLLKKECN